MKKPLITISLAVIIVLSSGTTLALTRLPNNAPAAAATGNAAGNGILKAEAAITHDTSGHNKNLPTTGKEDVIHTSATQNLYEIKQRLNNQENLNEDQGEIKSLELMTYKEFLASERNKRNIDTSLSPEKQVWVMKIHYPNGIKIDRVNPDISNKHKAQAYIIKNALRTILYDGETGESISVHDVSIQ